MSIPKMAKAMGYIDDDLVSGAIEYKREKKKNTWVKWCALAACLCLVFVGILTVPILTYTAQDYAQTVIYNDTKYVVCGLGEADILKECGLPSKITEESAGESLGYLKQTKKNAYCISKDETAGNVELFEYAPQPNDNVYIVRIEGSYYAAIRKDSEGYHGLIE